MLSKANLARGSQFRFFLAIVALTSLYGAAKASNSSLIENESTALAIERVIVLPMSKTGPKKLDDATVIIRNGRIVSITSGERVLAEL